MTDYQPVDQPVGGPDAEPQPARRYLGGFVSLHFVIKAIARQKRGLDNHGASRTAGRDVASCRDSAKVRSSGRAVLDKQPE